MPWNRNRPKAQAYGHTHQQARRRWAARHQPTDPCTRCGNPLGPMGPALHLDHNRTRDAYLGFAHARCNVRAGAREARTRQNITQLRW